MTHRPLYEFAQDIVSDYADRGKSVPECARAYVDPMSYLNQITDKFGYDDGDTVVIYALSNLTGWRGETAKRVKRELKQILHDFNPRIYSAPK